MAVSFPEAMRIRQDHVVAVSGSLAINIALLAWLVTPVAPRPPADNGGAIQVIWIEPEPRLPPQGPRQRDRSAPQISSSTQGPGAREPRIRTEAPSSTPRAEAPEAPGAEYPARSLDLSLPHAPLDYRADPMTRGRAQGEPARDRLNVQLIDRTLGGRMQAMAHALACGDLRRQLRRSPESSASSAAPMSRLGR